MPQMQTYIPVTKVPEPTPFDIDNYINTQLAEYPIDQSAERASNFTKSIFPFVRPFISQGYNAVAALNRGTAAFYAHLDSIADYVEESTGLKKGGLFDKLAEISKENSDYWRKRAEEVGISFIDEIVSEAAGGFVPGVSQFAMDVGSGFTFPYMAGAAEAEKGESPFAQGMLEAAKTGTLYGLFKMMGPLKQYLRVPAFGTVFGLEAAGNAPEGQRLKEFSKGAAIGAIYSMSSPGGQLGLNEVKQTTMDAIQSIKNTQPLDFAAKKLQEQRGSVGPEPEKRQRKFLKTAEEAKEIDPTLKEKIGEIKPQDYFVEPNPESFGKARERIEKEGVDSAMDFIRSDAPVSAEKGATFHELIRDAQKAGDWDRAIELVELYDQQAREAGRFIQTASTWTKLMGPEGFIRWANKQLRSVENKYSWMDTVIKRKPGSFELTKEEQQQVFETFRKIDEAERGEQGIVVQVAVRGGEEFSGGKSHIDAISRLPEETQAKIRSGEIKAEDGFIVNPEADAIGERAEFVSRETIQKRIGRGAKEDIDAADLIGERISMKDADPIDRSDATLELIDMVAKKVPPSVSELIDAYRYQNMLSSPKTQQRNIGENTFNTFMTRPIDITTRGAIDWTKSVLTGKEREYYISEAPLYLKTAINAIPNAVNAFVETVKLTRQSGIEKPELGIEARNEFETARARQIPTALTLVQRFMEASDRFNASIIGAGEMAIQMKKGIPEAEAYQKGQALAEEYLYRQKLEIGDPRLSYMSQVLNSFGKLIETSRKLPILGPIAKWYVPFIRTPINKAIQMVEHSPMAAARPLEGFKIDAQAKILSGSILMGLGALYAATEETTWAPPSNEEEKQLFYASGKRPYSIKMGDTWVPIWYLGPFALSFGLPAALKYYTQDNNKAITKDGYEKLIDIVEGTAQFIGSQSSTQNVGALFSALHGDVDFTFSSQTGFTVQQIIPASSLVRYINTIIDPVYRKPKGFVEGIEANLPVLSKNIEAHTTPLFEEAKREKINYFLPYDVGKSDDFYETILPMKQYELRQKAIESKMRSIIKDMQDGRISYEDSLKKMMKLSTQAPIQSTQQFVEDIKKRGKK